MSFDRLTDLALYRVELHVACHAVLLGGDSHQQEPLEGLVGAVVDDLTAGQTGVTVKHLQRL